MEPEGPEGGDPQLGRPVEVLVDERGASAGGVLDGELHRASDDPRIASQYGNVEIQSTNPKKELAKPRLLTDDTMVSAANTP